MTDDGTIPQYSLKRVSIQEGWCQDDYGREYKCERVVEDSDGDLFSSRAHNDQHVALFDIDMPAALRPSKTPGHYHLVVGQTMSWRRYKRLLRAMVRAGLIEKDWYRLVKRRGQALLAVEPFAVDTVR